MKITSVLTGCLYMLVCLVPAVAVAQDATPEATEVLDAITETQLVDVPVRDSLIITLPDDWLVWRYGDYADRASAYAAYQELYAAVGATGPFEATDIDALQFLALYPKSVSGLPVSTIVGALPLADVAAFANAPAESWTSDRQLEALGLTKTFSVELNGREIAVGVNPQATILLGAAYVFPDKGLTAFVTQLTPADFRAANLELLTLIMTSLRPEGEPLAIEEFNDFTGQSLPEGIALPGAAEATSEATTEAAVTCTVTAPRNVNLRGGPGTSYTAVGLLARGSSATATGQAPAADGIWYQLEGGNWVRSDVVRGGADCRELPNAEP